MRTVYPGTISDRGAAGAHVVDAWTTEVEENQDVLETEMGHEEDADHEIEALVAQYEEPLEEEEALDILAM